MSRNNEKRQKQKKKKWEREVFVIKGFYQNMQEIR